MKTQYILASTLLMTLVMMLASCSRKQAETSTVSLTLPQRTAKTSSANTKAEFSSLDDAPELGHVIINITGSGISAPVLLQWDKHNSPTTPKNFTVTVPRGDNRLIQVLAVYSSSSSQSMTFYYGDQVKSLASSEENADITVASMGGSVPTVSGNIYGRYLTGEDSGPSGDIDINYNPGAGKQKMLIQHAGIYNGWFNVFALSSVPFEYSLPNKDLLFGSAVSLSSPVFDPFAAGSAEISRRLRTAMPIHLRADGGSSDRKAEEAQIYVWGYWGSAAAMSGANWSTRKVCRDNLTGTLTRMFAYDSTPANWPTQQVLSSQLVTSAANIPQIADLINTATPKTSVSVWGGTTDCTGDMYSTLQRIKLTNIDGNGNDNAGGFRGPFKFDGNGNAYNITATDPRVIVADGLPGMTASIEDFKVFKKLGVTSDYSVDDFDCQNFATNTNPDGYVAAGAGSLDATGHLNLITNITADNVTAGVAAVLCPTKKGGGYYSNGLFLNAGMFSNQYSGTNGPLVASDLAIVAPIYKNSQTYAASACVPVSIRGMSSGQPAQFPGGTMATIASAGAINVFSDSYCGTAISGNLNIGGLSEYKFYVKSTTPDVQSITVATTGSLVLNKNTSVAFATSPGTVTAKLLIQTTNLASQPVSSIFASSCYKAKYEMWNDDGSTPPILLIDHYSLSFPGSGLSFYDMSAAPCMAPYPSTSFSFDSYYSPSQEFYFSYLGTASPISVIPTGATFTADGGTPITVAQPGLINKIQLSVPNVISEGACTPVEIRTVDSGGNASPVSADTNILLDAGSNATFYNYTGCGGVSATATILAGKTSIVKYLQVTAPGAIVLTADGSVLGLATATTPINVNAALADHLIAVLPGQVFNSGVLSGSPLPILSNQPFSVQIFALKYNNLVDATFTSLSLLSLQLNTSGVGAIVPTPNTVLFSNGQASFVATAGSDYNYNTFTFSATSVNGNISGNSAMFVTSTVATKFKIYMDSATALLPNACQIFAIVPEDASGSAAATDMSLVNLNASGGGAIYSDKGCTSPAVTPFSYSVSQRMYVFYFKDTAGSHSGSITTTVTGLSTDNLITTTLSAGTVLTATQWKILGMKSTAMTVGGRCNPYISYLADSNSMFKVPGSNVSNMRLIMGTLGGTAGAFHSDPQCQTAPLDPTPLTLYSSMGYYQSYADAPLSPGGGERLNVSDVSSIYTPMYVDLTRSN